MSTNTSRHLTLTILFLMIGICSAYSKTPILKNKKFGKLKTDTQTFTTYTAYIDVPENRNDSTSRIITLPVFVIQSSNPKPAEPVFWFEGGPGSSNITFTKNTYLLANHDFVCVGYRGADGPVLKSKKVGKAMKGKHGKVLSEESLDNVSVAVNDYFERLEKEGVALSCYTMMDVIEDAEYARVAMGYAKINLLSLSYGTRVALLYSYKYPDVINRSVMVGANPPGNFTWNPLETERAIDRYDSIYKAQHLTGYNGSIKQTMKTAFEKMPERWRGLKLDADKIKIGTFIAMFEVKNAVMAFDAYEKAAVKSDYSGLYALQLIYDFFAPKTIWGDMLLKGFSADFRPDTNYSAKYRAYSNTVLGPNYSLLLWSISLKKNFPTIPEEYRACRISQTPTLILSGTLDVSTPAVNAETQLMPYLPNGHLIKLENMSHADLLNAQTDSYRRCITTFFDTGVADASVFKKNEIDFTPKKNIGKITKRAYPIILIAKLFM